MPLNGARWRPALFLSVSSDFRALRSTAKAKNGVELSALEACIFLGGSSDSWVLRFTTAHQKCHGTQRAGGQRFSLRFPRVPCRSDLRQKNQKTPWNGARRTPHFPLRFLRTPGRSDPRQKIKHTVERSVVEASIFPSRFPRTFGRCDLRQKIRKYRGGSAPEASIFPDDFLGVLGAPIHGRKCRRTQRAGGQHFPSGFPRTLFQGKKNKTRR